MTRISDLPRDWRDRLNRAVSQGIENGGASCCGTRGVQHLPMCPFGHGVDVMTIESFFGLDEPE